MDYISVILLILIVAGIYLYFCTRNENFSTSAGASPKSNFLPINSQYFVPPNPDQPNIDYQDYLNNTSGYDSGTRGYFNPKYAQTIAAGLDTN